MGIVTALGTGIRSHREALLENRTGIRPLTLFPTGSLPPLPVGETTIPARTDGLPRTHHLACLAAEQAMANANDVPDAVVMGVTTGGMASTETLLRKKMKDPALYQRHATGSVAEEIAAVYDCRGPVLTV